MDEKKMKTLESFRSERDEFREKVHQMIDEAKLEQLTNQKYKSNTFKMTSEEIQKYGQLREKAKNLIAKAREGQCEEKSIKDENHVDEHSLSSLDPSILISSMNASNSNKEKIFKSYRVKKVKDLPDLKNKLDSRLHDSLGAGKENEDHVKSFKKPESSPIKSYYMNYALQDLEKELERIDKEADHLRMVLRNAIGKKDESGNDTEKYYLQRWFEIVNRRNAASRRQTQLTLLENEKELNSRYELLSKEYQAFNAIEESQKTDAQLKREKQLLEELVEMVNKRSELHMALDMEEQAIKDDAHAICASERSFEETNLDFESLNQDDETKCSLM